MKTNEEHLEIHTEVNFEKYNFRLLILSQFHICTEWLTEQTFNISFYPLDVTLIFLEPL